jgi:hypothetical protein
LAGVPVGAAAGGVVAAVGVDPAAVPWTTNAVAASRATPRVMMRMRRMVSSSRSAASVAACDSDARE